MGMYLRLHRRCLLSRQSFSVVQDGLLLTLLQDCGHMQTTFKYGMSDQISVHPHCVLGAFPPVFKADHLWWDQLGWMSIPGGNRVYVNYYFLLLACLLTSYTACCVWHFLVLFRVRVALALWPLQKIIWSATQNNWIWKKYELSIKACSVNRVIVSSTSLIQFSAKFTLRQPTRTLFPFIHLLLTTWELTFIRDFCKKRQTT